MITVGTVAGGKEHNEVYVDLEENGWVYLKQDDDWVCIPLSKLGDLVKILEKVECP